VLIPFFFFPSTRNFQHTHAHIIYGQLLAPGPPKPKIKLNSFFGSALLHFVRPKLSYQEVQWQRYWVYANHDFGGLQTMMGKSMA